MLVLLTAGAAHADSWWFFSSAKQLRSGVPPQVSDREVDMGAGDRMLVDSRRRLAAGDAETAQSQLEELIARFPNSKQAVEARRLLLDLYDVRGASRARAGAAAPMDPKAASALSALPVAPKPADRAPPPPTDLAPSALGSRRGASGASLAAIAGDRVFFDAGSAVLGRGERAVVGAQARWLSLHPAAIVTIEAHADDPGDSEVNRALSMERAESVRAALMKAGIDAERIRLAPLGSSQPIALCKAGSSSSDMCAAQNRRVISVVSWNGREVSASGPRDAELAPALAEPGAMESQRRAR
jgi:outer membrane protein OmpA-like peptidoglycan-associated protein